MAARIGARTDHSSDAYAEIVDHKLDEGAGDFDWSHLVALRPAEAIVADIVARLSKMA